MRIEIEIPKEFERDYNEDKFNDFFSRVLLDIDRKGACGLYKEEIAEMMIDAFYESKPAYDIDRVVEELEENYFQEGIKNPMCIELDKAIELVKRGGMNEQ